MALPACFSFGLLICLAIVSGGQAVECPRGWLSHNGHCFGYFPQELSWRQAQAYCQRQQANLASILDLGEHHAVADFLHRTQWDDEDVWIGFSIPPGGKVWTWADASPVSYTAWKRFKPSPTSYKYCAHLDEDSGFMLWDNESCNDRNAFLCKL